MSSYGPKTAFGVGMIHGIGAETGTQVLLIAAVGGAASAGLGIPMLFAFVVGLLISNFAIVVLTSVGFVASQTRERIYVVDRRWSPGCSASCSGRSTCSAWTRSSRRWTRSPVLSQDRAAAADEPATWATAGRVGRRNR